ncbi:hypothetical protein L9F63_009236, partial [Diploptera punctata]
RTYRGKKYTWYDESRALNHHTLKTFLDYKNKIKSVNFLRKKAIKKARVCEKLNLIQFYKVDFCGRDIKMPLRTPSLNNNLDTSTSLVYIHFCITVVSIIRYMNNFKQRLRVVNLNS